MGEPKIIFVYGYWQRCGHNYLSEILRKVLKTYTPIENISEFHFPKLLKEFNQNLEHIRNRAYQTYIKDTVYQGLSYKIKQNCEADYVLIKTTHIDGIDMFVTNMPDAIHLLLIRDPRNVISSFLKALKMQIYSSSSIKNTIRRWLFFAGYYHLVYSKRVAKRLDMIQRIISNPSYHNLHLIRYEDINSPSFKKLKKLFLMINFTLTNDQYEKIKGIPVLNTSYKEELNATRSWADNPKTKNFDPNNRWEKISFLHKVISSFFINRQILKQLEYS